MSLRIVALATTDDTLVPLKYIETLRTDTDEETLTKCKLADEYYVYIRTHSGAEYTVSSSDMAHTVQQFSPDERFNGEEVRNVIVHLWIESLDNDE